MLDFLVTLREVDAKGLGNSIPSCFFETIVRHITSIFMLLEKGNELSLLCSSPVDFWSIRHDVLKWENFD